MMEYTGFAEVNAVVLAAPTILLIAFALVTAWMNHLPSRIRAFELAPAFGL